MRVEGTFRAAYFDEMVPGSGRFILFFRISSTENVITCRFDDSVYKWSVEQIAKAAEVAIQSAKR